MTRRKPTRPTKRQRAKAIKVLAAIVENPDTPDYVRVRGANAILAAGSRDETPEAEAAGPGAIVFVPRKDRLPGQREDETRLEFTDRRKAWVEGRRAVYCESLGEDYDPARPLPCWPWPTPGSDPELEDEADRRADEAEAAAVERQRGSPRPEPAEVLGPREDAPGVVIFDSLTPEGLADMRRWRAEAEAAGGAVLAPQ